MGWYLTVLKKFSDFDGRARRKEYWMFVLLNFVFSICAMVLDHVLGIAFDHIGYGPLYLIYGLAVILPGVAVSIRRLHDTGNSGWMIWINFIIQPPGLKPPPFRRTAFSISRIYEDAVK